MSENFRRPYFARSMDEFWRRWHISLGEWMKDYLFYPLALSGTLNRVGKVSRKHFGAYIGKLTVPCIATVVVFLMVGIWQGPGWSNVAYGLWNGGLISLSMLLENSNRQIRNRLCLSEDTGWFWVFQVGRTCLFVIIGRYFSRSDSLYQALQMLWRTIRYFGQGGLNLESFTNFGLSSTDWIQIILAGAVLFLLATCRKKEFQ